VAEDDKSDDAPAPRTPTGALEAARDPTAAWRSPPAGKLIGKGHPTGDFLEAYDWKIVEQRPGFYALDVHLPTRAKNLRGELFGGFSPTYVDLVSLRTVASARTADSRGRLVTLSMNIDYFEPVNGPRFRIECEVRHRRGKTWLVETRFRDEQGALLLLALTTFRETS
jgi:acyl-coenzyme A thioesterase PaaI-like protein